MNGAHELFSTSRRTTLEAPPIWVEEVEGAGSDEEEEEHSEGEQEEATEL